MTTDGIIRVLYYDYLGFEHNGVVLLTQPINDPEAEEGEVYLFIRDDRDEFNDKTFTDDHNVTIRYAEIRRSTECIRIS